MVNTLGRRVTSCWGWMDLRSTLKRGLLHLLNICVGYLFTAFIVVLFLISFFFPFPFTPPFHFSLHYFPPFTIIPKFITSTYRRSSQFPPHCTTETSNSPSNIIWEDNTLSPRRTSGCFPHVRAAAWCCGLTLPHLFTLTTARFANTTAWFSF